MPTVKLPPRDAIARNYLRDETAVIETLLPVARLDETARQRADTVARGLVNAARSGRRHYGGVDAFMAEYQLSSEEGVVLMCLAEALLRIPDGETADKLIADKIGGRAWDKHLGHSESLFVNASTWGLMLTGQVLGLGRSAKREPNAVLKNLVRRSGEPVIRQAMRQAMRIMGKQYVLGRTIKEALETAAEAEAEGYRHSYDMLGEAAMTMADADRYFDSYRKALHAVADAADRRGGSADIFSKPSISVKLSALHPRYEEKQHARVMGELLPRVAELAAEAKKRGIGLTIDAEEADRLDISLELFGRLAADPALAGWNGLGLAVQAYGKRALPVIDWLAALAEKTGRKLPVRLVKGAYWDTEIKRAQEQGLSGYPVFTRKASTDVSYLACARRMLDRRDVFYPQLATHNAHSVAAVSVMAGNRGGFEFQRLHGMGQALYEAVVPKDRMDIPCRIYAPVGSHEDLLAYLVRRLLENGANTSFVNRLADDDAPIAEIVADPVARVSGLASKPNPRIPAPRDIFRPERAAAEGVVLSDDTVRGALLEGIAGALSKPFAAAALIGGKKATGRKSEIACPHDRSRVVGTVVEASANDVDRALELADKAQEGWDRAGGEARAAILDRAADLYEANATLLLGLLVREAGKTLDNAQADLREAVDFLRYYAARARDDFGQPMPLPGPTGERNTLSLHGRGVFACISPWNFPLAIFTGQVAAALAAGNAVCAKPAEQTPLVAFEGVRLMHRAGVPADVLHFLPGRGEVVGARLTADPRIAGVAFTGSNETARLIQRSLAGREGPIVPLIAETGGINAMIVDSTALPEQTVRDVVRSAFDSAGQRCSALRVLCLQADIADKVLTMLDGAMRELVTGDPEVYSTDIGPVIDEDARAMLEAHKEKMRNEARVIRELPLPKGADKGVFVAPAAYEIARFSDLKGEVFGPILHVVRFRAGGLSKLCDDINATGYGLTLGVHTRIDTTADEVAARAKVGNLYINRNQIGAVVGSQPFGGEGLSGTGPKAGGPHYLPRFAVERVRSTDTTASGGNAALMSMEPGDD